MKSTAVRIPHFETHRARERMFAEVVAGLSASAKSLPTKYLYDARGSELFEEICELPEYYPTRTELAIMRAHGGEMAEHIGPRAYVIEYGSGASVKTRRLLDALVDPVAYAPVDISADHLRDTVARLAGEYPRVEMLPVAADFTAAFEVPRSRRTPDRRVVYFPGSTIGNFRPWTAIALMRRMAAQVGLGGALLIGVDLRKDRQTLERAYDDAQGVTAEFDLNLLRHVNRELGANFDLDSFRHEARWNDEDGRVELHLVSLRAQRVAIGDREFAFAAGERIHTEDSHKYSLEQFAELADAAGWRERVAVWTDSAALFSVQLYAR
jgi:L-histidine Nalpha-methyltransferase